MKTFEKIEKQNFFKNCKYFSIVYWLTRRQKKASRQNYTYKFSRDNKILSSLITKTCRTCTFLNHFREANEYWLCTLSIESILFFLYKISLLKLKKREDFWILRLKTLKPEGFNTYLNFPNV